MGCPLTRLSPIGRFSMMLPIKPRTGLTLWLALMSFWIRSQSCHQESGIHRSELSLRKMSLRRWVLWWRGTGRMAATAGDAGQGPKFTSHIPRPEAKQASDYKSISLFYFHSNRRKGRCQELSMTVRLTASRRNTVVLNWSGQEGMNFNSLGLFFSVCL